MFRYPTHVLDCSTEINSDSVALESLDPVIVFMLLWVLEEITDISMIIPCVSITILGKAFVVL